MTTAFVNKVRTKNDKLGVQSRRYRVIKARSTARVLAQVNRLTRWGWVLENVGGITPRATITKTEIITDDGEMAEVLFPNRYDAEQKKYVSVYYKYATKWAFTQEKLLSHTNNMLSRGYEVSFNVPVVFGYRTVYVRAYVKDTAEDLS